jgi:hypothetical protein
VLFRSPLPDKRVRLVAHRVFQPSASEPLDFEATIEATLIDLSHRFAVRRILFDPYQMQAVAQRLQKRGLPIMEFPQSSPNLTIASQNLYELVESRGLVLYPDAAMRLAASRAIAIETSRGWRIAKEKQSHKIDVVVALGMAAHAAVTVCEQTPARFGWQTTTGAGFNGSFWIGRDAWRNGGHGQPESTIYPATPEGFRSMIAAISEK